VTGRRLLSGDGPASADMRDDSVELVEAVIADHEPPAAPPVLDGDGRAELLGELRLEAADVRVLRAGGAVRPLGRPTRQPADGLLRVADAPAFLADLRRELERDGGRRHGEERARMAHIELTVLEHRADGFRQLEKPEQVADRHPRSADGFSRLPVS